MRARPTLALAALMALACGGELSETASSPPPSPEAAAAPADSPSEPARCADHDPLRQAFFGELHIHTAVSMDAYLFQTRVRPDDAYRFARGEPVKLPPLDAEGEPTRPVQLERPLDFAAVTDHASNFGAVRLCTDPSSPVYSLEACRGYQSPIDTRAAGDLRTVIRQLTEQIGTSLVSEELCGKDGERCRAAGAAVWEETRRAAAAHQSAAPGCEFTTFVAYEYTATPELTKIHRNVIFRNQTVPELPISYADEPDAVEMWRRLARECNDAGTGCEALAIPHNSNLSNGHMFDLEYGGAQGDDAQAEVAALRARMEPLVEMMQMKGDSECRNDMWKVLGGNDELCDFEKLRPAETPDCEDGRGKGALAGEGCVSTRDYARYALIDGLREQARLGVNPFAFGLVAATDGHDGTPGATEEWRQDLVLGRPGPAPGRSLGGLAGVWAEENSRDAIFDAMLRRETFGTSGPRMTVRFFGGWDYPDDLCSQPDLVARGYAEGVPMGSDLPPRAGTAPPVFVVSAMRDPGTEQHPGGLLQRIQIIKGWAGADGAFHQQIVDVAGSADNGADVDPKTCTPRGPGHDALCGVWRDPDFDPALGAVYYARVVENPSCRQDAWTCLRAPDPSAVPWCGEDTPRSTIQERAWSSPIWYPPERRVAATR